MIQRTLALVLLLPSLLLVPGVVHCQDLMLTPKWKKGDARTMYITETTTTVENGEVKGEHTESQTAKAKVADVQPEWYMLNIEYRNVVLHHARELSDGLGSEFDPWKILLLRYKVDRRTGAMDLFNWEEVRDAANASYEQVKRALRKEDTELVEVMEMIMQPVLFVYSDKEMLSQYFASHVEFLSFAFGKALTMGSPLQLEERTPSPFAEGDSLTTVIKMHLESIDIATDLATIRAEEVVDPQLYKMIMQGMVQQFTDSLSVDGDGMILTEKEIKEQIKAIALDMTREQIITVDIATAWPKRSVATMSATVKAAGRTSNTTSQLTVEVR